MAILAIRNNYDKAQNTQVIYPTVLQQALVKLLTSAHVPQEMSADQFGSYVASLTIDN